MPSCLFCAEEIQKGTTRCPHCGESLDTERTSLGLARWRGDALLVVAEGGSVPARGCAICASSEATQRERTFVYTPRWVYLGLLGGVLPFLILALVGRKRARVWVPLCNDCLRRWRAGQAGLVLYAVLGLVGLPWLCGAIFETFWWRFFGEDAFWVGVAPGLLLWLGGAVAIKRFLARRYQVRCTLVAEDEASLVFPDVARIRPLVELLKL